jgi:hypothetical protein
MCLLPRATLHSDSEQEESVPATTIVHTGHQLPATNL